MNVTEAFDPPVVAVIRADAIHDPVALVQAFLAGGVKGVEFTLTTPGALAAVQACRGSGAAIGVGTVLDRSQAEQAIAAGAQFLVSPVVDEAVIDCGRAAGVPVVPGAFTPTEIRRARVAGAMVVKLFPARLASLDYVRELRGVMPDVRLIPSGGIGVENAAAYLRAGAQAISSGTATAPPTAVAGGDHEEITRRARELVMAVEGALASDAGDRG